MKLTVFTALFILLVCSGLQAQTPEIAFVNVNVVPMDKERILPKQTVIVRDGKIVAMGPAATINVPKGVRRIEGTGKYLMPGLADMHAHFAVSGTSPNEMADNQAISVLFVANGVTTVRNMWGTPVVLALRKQIDGGQVLGPHIFTTGPINGDTRPTTRRVLTVEQAAAVVAEDKKAGYDAIKITRVPRTIYDALVAAARKEGLPVYGHVSDGSANDEPVSLAHTLELRQDSIEHLGGHDFALLAKGSPPPRGFQQAVANMDWSLLPGLVAATRAAGTWLCPTLVDQSKFVTSEEAAKLLAEPAMRYIPGWLMENWKKSPSINLNAQRGAERKAFFEFKLKLTKALHDGGVGMLLGTDCMNPLNVPGFSIHEELAYFVKAGLTPYQALRAGTSGAAEFLKQQDEFGTVAVGQRADLLLLEANPLEDVRNAAKRVGVMVRGQWFTEAELQERLEKQAASYAKR